MDRDELICMQRTERRRLLYERLGLRGCGVAAVLYKYTICADKVRESECYYRGDVKLGVALHVKIE